MKEVKSERDRKKIIKRVIGYTMLVALAIALIAAMMIVWGVPFALKILGIEMVVIIWIGVAAWLTER